MKAPNLTPNALRVLEARYLLRDGEGKLLETPEALLDRVAQAVAEAGKRCDGEDFSGPYRDLLRSLDFLPNSPTLMNAGIEGGQLSACFVVPVEDDLEAIFESVKRMALIQRTGGGTGFSFSRLRPRGDFVAGTNGVASGPVSFLQIFDTVTEQIKQGGKRRGANMGILRVDHPDILEFIRLKADPSRARNFNLSVGMTDAFMEAVEKGGSFDLVHPRTKERVETVKAADLFATLVQTAWECGDPGLVFLDAIQRTNPTPHVAAIEATNPCGEIPLLPWEACNLGSIHLGHMTTGDGEIDWDKLRQTTQLAVRFLDDVIEASTFPFPEIEGAVRGNRKIGLGVMGFADLLIQLEISYDSGEAVALAERIMERINAEARTASEALAETRGPYPNFPGSPACEAGDPPLRNATRTAVAPTGTIGIIADASPGIEPLFALAFRRSGVLGGQTLTEVHPEFLRRVEQLGAKGEAILEPVKREGTLRTVEGVPETWRTLFLTAHEIAPERHLEIQAAFQRHTDNAVSKTINLSHDATPEAVDRIYRQAWKMGVKGITVFRDGCRPEQVMEAGEVAEGAAPLPCDTC